MKAIVAVRTRSVGLWLWSFHFAKMEIRKDNSTTSSLTSVQKDNLILEVYEQR